jgi:hypothetical protein
VTSVQAGWPRNEGSFPDVGMDISVGPPSSTPALGPSQPPAQ